MLSPRAFAVVLLTPLSLLLAVALAGCSGSSTGGAGGGGTGSTGTGSTGTVTGCPASGELSASPVGTMAQFDCPGPGYQGSACYCDASGQWLNSPGHPCNTQPSCPATCTYNGNQYVQGEAFPAGDGCNTCSCSSSGQADCTLLACPVDAGPVDAGTD
jgi:hypothetical protein